jgi:hypothetical protein
VSYRYHLTPILLSYGNVYSRTAIMAVVGGTTSAITGGKFANGAEKWGFCAFV